MQMYNRSLSAAHFLFFSLYKTFRKYILFYLTRSLQICQHLEFTVKAGFFPPTFEIPNIRNEWVTTFLKTYLPKCLVDIDVPAEAKNTDVWSLETSKQGYEF